jgi:hypothetical protein
MATEAFEPVDEKSLKWAFDDLSDFEEFSVDREKSLYRGRALSNMSNDLYDRTRSAAKLVVEAAKSSQNEVKLLDTRIESVAVAIVQLAINGVELIKPEDLDNILHLLNPVDNAYNQTFSAFDL